LQGNSLVLLTRKTRSLKLAQKQVYFFEFPGCHHSMLPQFARRDMNCISFTTAEDLPCLCWGGRSSLDSHVSSLLSFLRGIFLTRSAQLHPNRFLYFYWPALLLNGGQFWPAFSAGYACVFLQLFGDKLF